MPNFKLSPEFQCPHEMERWYKVIGDEYPLYLMRQLDEADAQIKELQKEIEDSFDPSLIAVPVRTALDDLEDWLHNRSEITNEKDLETLTKYIERINKIVADY